jgi:hypothetical protein
MASAKVCCDFPDSTQTMHITQNLSELMVDFDDMDMDMSCHQTATDGIPTMDGGIGRINAVFCEA